MLTLVLADFTSSVHHGKHGNQLWQFLKDLLYQPNLYRNCIAWIDRSKGYYHLLELNDRVLINIFLDACIGHNLYIGLYLWIYEIIHVLLQINMPVVCNT